MSTFTQYAGHKRYTVYTPWWILNRQPFSVPIIQLRLPPLSGFQCQLCTLIIKSGGQLMFDAHTHSVLQLCGGTKLNRQDQFQLALFLIAVYGRLSIWPTTQLCNKSDYVFATSIAPTKFVHHDSFTQAAYLRHFLVLPNLTWNIN